MYSSFCWFLQSLLLYHFSSFHFSNLPYFGLAAFRYQISRLGFFHFLSHYYKPFSLLLIISFCSKEYRFWEEVLFVTDLFWFLDAFVWRQSIFPCPKSTLIGFRLPEFSFCDQNCVFSNAKVLRRAQNFFFRAIRSLAFVIISISWVSIFWHLFPTIFVWFTTFLQSFRPIFHWKANCCFINFRKNSIQNCWLFDYATNFKEHSFLIKRFCNYLRHLKEHST